MSCIVIDTDTTIEITLKDEEGVVIDIGNLAGLIVEVFQKDVFFDKFSLISQTGFRDINVLDAPNGKFEIFLNANNTTNGEIGKIVFYEAKTLATNVNFDDSTEEKSTGWIELAKLISSEMVNESFL